jgi:uncharacterized membrane protein
MDTMVVLAGRYNNEKAAIDDFQSVKNFYKVSGLVDTYDAAVIHREDGNVKIVKKREEPTRHGALAGLGLGLAAGVVAAAFPAVAIGGALVAGGAGGAALGALTGHVTRGMSREDLKEIGEFLDQGESALIVVAASDVEDRVRGLMAAADATTQERIDANVSQLDAEISAASESQSSGAQGSASQRSGSK